MKFLDEFKEYKSVLNFTNKSVTFFGSARFNSDNEYCKAAKKLAFMLSEHGLAVITGGGDGIMRAANEGAYESGKSHSIGFNIRLPFEQGTNPFINGEFLFSNFSPRKFALIESSMAFVVFPGGYGTLDELFEVLVLTQTGMKNVKIFLYGCDFWRQLDDFIKTTLIQKETIDKQDVDIYEITDDIELICDKILKI